jgi:hypothetical protein
MTRHLVNVNRRLLWGLVGENGFGGRGSFELASLALVYRRRCGDPGMCGGGIPGHAGAYGRIPANLGKLDFVPRSGTNVAGVEGTESRNPLPIVLNNLLMEGDGPKRVVGRGIAEPMRDRRGVWERLVFNAPDDTEIYNGQTSKQCVRVGSVIIFELLLGTEGDFVAVNIGVGYSDLLKGNAVQRLELVRYFGPRRGLSKDDATI